MYLVLSALSPVERLMGSLERDVLGSLPRGLIVHLHLVVRRLPWRWWLNGRVRLWFNLGIVPAVHPLWQGRLVFWIEGLGGRVVRIPWGGGKGRIVYRRRLVLGFGR